MLSPEQKPCSYCWEEKILTREHIIPRGWYSKTASIKKPLIIGACLDCNRDKSVDDEWVRKWLVSMTADRSSSAMEVLRGPVARSIKYKPKLGRDVMDRMKLVDVYHQPTGLYLGMQTQISISDDDWSRVVGHVDKIIQGLYALDNQRPLPTGFGVLSFYACDEWIKPIPAMFQPFRQYLPWPQAWHISDPETFFYGRAYADDCGYSIWFTVFYNSVAFLSFVGRHEWLEQNRMRFAEQRINRDFTQKYGLKEVR
ncbi:MAG: hypothetical protein WCV84_05265 [Patescibacteria group bacterium]